MNELERLINQFSPQIRKAFQLAIRDIVDRAIIGEITRAIRAGDLVGAFRAIGFSEAALRPITSMIEQAFETGGVTTVQSFPTTMYAQGIGRIVFRFDVRNSRAEAYLRDHSSQLVTRLTEEARTNVRNALTQGMIEGRNPRNVALDIVGRIDQTTQRRVGGVIGLSEPMERYVAGMRRDLQGLDSRYFTRERRDKRFDAIVQRAIASGRPLDAETINKLVGRYSDRLLQLRGEMIGRTEALSSLHRSQYEAYKQAIDAGALKESQVVKHWDATGDDRTRATHMAAMEQYKKQGVGIDEPFMVGGSLMMHPGDTSLGASAKEIVACRCRVRYDVDFLEDID